MRPAYADIKAKIAQEPIWYDDGGVPRYDQFRPDMLGVYDSVAVYYEIACQACSRHFMVAQGWPDYQFCRHEARKSVITPDNLHYGDPPRHGDPCVAGDTMNCIDIRVIEWWEKPELWKGWRRRPEYERPIDTDHTLPATLDRLAQTWNRPLSKAMERALVLVAAGPGRIVRMGEPEEWQITGLRAPGRLPQNERVGKQTVEALERRLLISCDPGYRLTDSGRKAAEALRVPKGGAHGQRRR